MVQEQISLKIKDSDIKPHDYNIKFIKFVINNSDLEYKSYLFIHVLLKFSLFYLRYYSDKNVLMSIKSWSYIIIDGECSWTNLPIGWTDLFKGITLYKTY